MEKASSAESRSIRESRRPLYLSIAQTLQTNIEGGKYAKGDFLPSERDLSQLFDVSRITIRKALSMLSDKSIIIPHGRSGYEISSKANTNGRAKELSEEYSPSEDLLMALPFYANHSHGNKLVEHLEKNLVRRPYKLVLRNTQEDLVSEVEIFHSIDHSPPSCTLMLPSGYESSDYAFDFSRIINKTRLIFLDRYILGVPAPYIGTRNFDAIRNIVRTLHNLGHRRIAFVGYKGISAEKERYFGYRMGLELCGIPFDENLVSFETELKMENTHYGVVGKRSTSFFLSLKSPPTAIIAMNDFVASGVCAEITERGLRIPEDISVTGFDEDAIAQAIVPGGISTFQHNYNIMIEVLLSLLVNQKALSNDIHITIPAIFKDKGTVGKPPR